MYGYQYDQLNRLVQMDAYGGLGTNGTFSPVKLSDYAERVSYDPNGNITSYIRHGNPSAGNPVQMDSMFCNYTSGTNKLDYIQDTVPSSNYAADIDGQDPGNYSYDSIGNLTANVKDSISNINWTVYGKIDSITKMNGTGIKYIYDAAGNRISTQLKL